MNMFQISDEAREQLVKLMRGTGECPYTDLELTQIVDIAVHALNEGVAKIREVAKISPDPLLSTATASRIFVQSHGVFLDYLRAENKAECDCLKCQLERAFGYEKGTMQ